MNKQTFVFKNNNASAVFGTCYVLKPMRASEESFLIQFGKVLRLITVKPQLTI